MVSDDTALGAAASQNSTEAVKILIAAKADIHQGNANVMSLFGYGCYAVETHSKQTACCHGGHKCVNYLVHASFPNLD